MGSKGALGHVGIVNETTWGKPKIGDSGIATGGSVITLIDTTKAWEVGFWVGYRVRIISGLGLGQFLTITANTATTLTFASATAPDATSVYEISKPEIIGTATAGDATTLTDSGETWTVNGYKNYTVRITDGTGVGQIRTIISNTADVLTVSVVFSPVPSTDSVYEIVAVEKYTKFTSESLTTAIEELMSTSLTGKRDEPDQYQGAITNSGDSVHEFHPNDMGHILKSWFGSVASSEQVAGVYQHIFTPVNTQFNADCELPPYSLKVHRDLGSANSIHYLGCVANVLSWAFGVGTKILTLTSSWIAKKALKVSKSTPSFETTDPFLWLQSIFGVDTVDSGTATSGTATTLVDTGGGWAPDAFIGYYVRITGLLGVGQVRKILDNDATTLTVATWGINPDSTSTYEIYQAAGNIETMGITMENGLVGFPMLNQIREIGKLVGDAFRMGTISPTFHTTDLTKWDKFINFTSEKWYITFQGPKIAATNFYYELEFQFPKVIYTAQPINIAGPGRITVGASGKIKYDSTAGYLCRIRLVNSVSAYV